MGQGREATLDELLAEPITRLVMLRDGVSESDIRRVVARLAKALRAAVKAGAGRR